MRAMFETVTVENTELIKDKRAEDAEVHKWSSKPEKLRRQTDILTNTLKGLRAQVDSAATKVLPPPPPPTPIHCHPPPSSSFHISEPPPPQQHFSLQPPIPLPPSLPSVSTPRVPSDTDSRDALNHPPPPQQQNAVEVELQKLHVERSELEVGTPDPPPCFSPSPTLRLPSRASCSAPMSLSVLPISLLTPLCPFLSRAGEALEDSRRERQEPGAERGQGAHH